MRRLAQTRMVDATARRVCSCGAVRVETPSGCVCPHGHGRIVRAIGSDRAALRVAALPVFLPVAGSGLRLFRVNGESAVYVRAACHRAISWRARMAERIDASRWPKEDVDGNPVTVGRVEHDRAGRLYWEVFCFRPKAERQSS